MNSFSYHVPTKVIFGKDSLSKLVEELKPYAPKKILVLYGSGSVIKTGVLGQVTDILAAAGYEYLEIGGVQPNPLLSFANETRDLAVKEGVDFVLAVGGGSVIDTAKGIAHGIKQPDVDLWDIWNKKVDIKETTPIATILTISAAGSETSNSAVLTNKELTPPRKVGLSTEFNRPLFSILNPEFTFTLPKYQVACGAVDIFMHTADRYFAAENNNEITLQFAEGVMRVVFKYAVAAANNPFDYESMSELMWTGSLSHNQITGLGSINDFTPHILSHELSSLFNATHGEALCLTWNAFANYAYAKHTDIFSRYGRNVLGIVGDDDLAVSKEAVDKTVKLFKDLGLATNAQELLGRKFTDEEIETLALGCSIGKTRVVGSMEPITYPDMVKIYSWLNN